MPTGRTSVDRRFSSTWPAWAAFGWGVTFGLWNVYWSLGGDFGLDWLAESIQDDARAGDTTLLVVNSVGGVGKIVAGVLAVATIAPWGQAIPRKLHLGLLYAGGVLVLLYGGANWTQLLLVKIGVVDVPQSIGAEQVSWYLFLWEPIWILGGALFILTAVAYQKTPLSQPGDQGDQVADPHVP